MKNFIIFVLILALIFGGRCSMGGTNVPREYWVWIFTTEVALPGIAAAGVLIASLPRAR